MKVYVFLFFLLPFAFKLKAQSDCTFKKPAVTIHFGTGNVRDVNATVLNNYERVKSMCPTDNHYTYTPYTADCFNSHWFTLAEDHTPGDVSGNMMLVNSSYNAGTFLKTTVSPLKGGTTYEVGVWLMNVCIVSTHCPSLLLPDITIQLQTASGKILAQFRTGEVGRTQVPLWKQHRAVFTTPASETSLELVMTNNNPGGCGNDFALDDITFRECVKTSPPTAITPKKTVGTKKQVSTPKPEVKKPMPAPAKDRTPTVQPLKTQKDSLVYSTPVIKPRPQALPPPPPVLATRTNTVARQIVMEAGEIRINLYDNGEIDGDTISIYHNNVLLVAHARLSQKPISLTVNVDASSPHHEFVMVAENLGSIPPNTSLMVITAGTTRHEVYISSTKEKNAKVILDLKE